mmetsp:Transcript_5969/g.10285  ORF Transcript_5969/g.10285 Transcript_5969/m.10285 type:complete len:84 (-) Transcript_5969:169-420(-)
MVDRDYFQHVEEASYSALRIACRAIVIAAYGVIICVFVLQIAIPGILTVVVSDVLPRVIDVDSSMDMMANDSHEYEMIGHDEI